MSYQPFLIANTKAGMDRYNQPWLIPDDAYPDLEDCFLFRGRVVRRLGSEFLGRLQRQPRASDGTLLVTDGAGDATFTLPNFPLQPGSSGFQVTTSFLQDSSANATLLTNSAATGTINTTTGAITITGAAINSPIIYFPGLPVMGLSLLESTVGNPLVVNQEMLVAFDTKFSYLFTGSPPAFQDLTFYTNGSPFIWHGTDYEFFWTYNYQNAMFATNNKPGMDGARFDTIATGATTKVTVNGGDLTAQFVAGDFAFIIPDANTVTFTATKTNQGGGTIASSTVVAGNTEIVVNVASSGAATTGLVLNSTRQIGAVTALGPPVKATIGDGVKWLDQNASGWSNFQPPLSGVGINMNYLQGALIVVPFKGRLVFLNTQEGTFAQAQANTCPNFAQRARWSSPTTVYYNQKPTNFQGGTNPIAWRSDIIGNGGFIDAPTTEQIISAEYVKDTLVVYFERSTWQLRYTGNQYLPFVWEKINTELGANSTFSVVPFDRQTIAIGNVGIHACDSVNVERIDQRIPDEVFLIQQLNNGSERVYGIRDYENQLVYWTLPYSGNQDVNNTPITFPNKVLVWNYVEGSFSYFNDSYTCYGYVQSTTDKTWAETTTTWEETSSVWVSPTFQAQFPPVCAGNQVGFVVLIQQQVNNDDSLFISNITPGAATILTVINHNLPSTAVDDGLYVKITSASGTMTLTQDLVGKIYAVNSVIDANNFTIDTPVPPTGTFTGVGTIAVVNNMSILTKKFNPFVNEGTQVRLGYLDFYVDKTVHGQFTLNIYADDDSTIPINIPFVTTISNINNTISNITKAALAVITVPLTTQFQVGDVVWIDGVDGMYQINQQAMVINSVVNSGPNTLITIDFDTSAYSVYISGGQIYNLSKSDLNVVNTFPESTLNISDDIALSNQKIWKRLQNLFIAQFYQLEFTFSDIQMRSDPIINSEFALHGLIAYFSKAGRIINV